MLVLIAWLVLLPQRWTLIKPFVVSICSRFVFPFSFSKSWERTGVGFSTIPTSYNNVYMRGETLIMCYHCSRTYVSRNPSMPGAAWVGVWKQCLSPGSCQPSHARKNCWRDIGKVPVQVTGRDWIWGRQIHFLSSWVTAHVYCHWPKPTSPSITQKNCSEGTQKYLTLP